MSNIKKTADKPQKSKIPTSGSEDNQKTSKKKSKQTGNQKDKKADELTRNHPVLDTLVSTKEALLKLYDVEAHPLLTGTDSKTNRQANRHRLELYHAQYERTKQLYLATESVRPTYLVQSIKHQFGEYAHFQMSAELDKRGRHDTDEIRQLWQQLHIVDDIIVDLVQRMPAHHPVGWQLTSQTRNHLRLPTVGRQRFGDSLPDQTSLPSYVLGHFGVMSYTYDRAYYIGHILGYLFSCYYFAYLSIGYGVMPLSEKLVKDFEYTSLKTPHLVRLLQTLDGESKKRIYQLAVICGKLSMYATDKRIEKLLVAEVNDFNKKEQKQHLKQWLEEGVMPLSVIKDEDEEEGDN